MPKKQRRTLHKTKAFDKCLPHGHNRCNASWHSSYLCRRSPTPPPSSLLSLETPPCTSKFPQTLALDIQAKLGFSFLFKSLFWKWKLRKRELARWKRWALGPTHSKAHVHQLTLHIHPYQIWNFIFTLWAAAQNSHSGLYFVIYIYI